MKLGGRDGAQGGYSRGRGRAGDIDAHRLDPRGRGPEGGEGRDSDVDRPNPRGRMSGKKHGD